MSQRFRKLQSYLHGDILDLGCGLAYLLEFVKPSQVYVGIEGHPEIYDWLQKNRPRYSFYHRDLDHEPLQIERQFETVVMSAVLEHLAYPEFVLRQIPALLKPGGRLLVTTPTILGDRLHRFGARWGIFSMYAVQDHEIIYNEEMLRRLLPGCGLRIDLYRKFLLGGNQLVVCSNASAQEKGSY